MFIPLSLINLNFASILSFWVLLSTLVPLMMRRLVILRTQLFFAPNELLNCRCHLPFPIGSLLPLFRHVIITSLCLVMSPLTMLFLLNILLAPSLSPNVVVGSVVKLCIPLSLLGIFCLHISFLITATLLNIYVSYAVLPLFSENTLLICGNLPFQFDGGLSFASDRPLNSLVLCLKIPFCLLPMALLSLSMKACPFLNIPFVTLIVNFISLKLQNAVRIVRAFLALSMLILLVTSISVLQTLCTKLSYDMYLRVHLIMHIGSTNLTLLELRFVPFVVLKTKQPHTFFGFVNDGLQSVIIIPPLCVCLALLVHNGPTVFLHCGWIETDFPYGFTLLDSLGISYTPTNLAHDTHHMFLDILLARHLAAQVLRSTPITPPHHPHSPLLSLFNLLPLRMYSCRKTFHPFQT